MSIRNHHAAPIFSLAHVTDHADRLRERLAIARFRRRVYNETWAELSELTDRELSDLGFVRSDIERIAHESAEMAVRERAIRA